MVGVETLITWGFLPVALLYFLAPVLGYSAENRGNFILSLLTLLGVMGACLLDKVLTQTGEVSGKAVPIIFTVIIGGGMIAAFFFFVKALQELKKQ